MSFSFKFNPNSTKIDERSIYLSALNSLDASCSEPEWREILVCAKAAGLTFEDADSWSSTSSDKYKGSSDVKKKWDDITKIGKKTAASLIYLARKNGWEDPRKSKKSTPIRTIKDAPRKGSISSKEIKKAIQSVSEENNHLPDINEIWNLCTPADIEHPYIDRKGGIEHGLRVVTKKLPIKKDLMGWLAIPVFQDEELQTIQFIAPYTDPKDGSTIQYNLGDKVCKKAGFNDGFFSWGNENEDIFIAEGIGHCWSINTLFSGYFVVTFGSGRLEDISKIIRKKYPKNRIIIIADVGMESKCDKIAHDISAAVLKIPGEHVDNYDINDFALENDFKGVEELINNLIFPDIIDEKQENSVNLKFKPLSDEDINNMPDMEWLVRGIVPKNSIGTIYGKSGTGKSFLSMQLAFDISLGKTHWFDYPIKQAPVLYFCLEGQAGLKKRIQAWKKYNDIKEIPKNFYPVATSLQIFNEEDISEIINTVLHCNIKNGLIIIDTLHKAMGGQGDENSSVDMGKLTAIADKIRIETGCTVLFVHHSGKDETKGMRGHSSLGANIDFCLHTERNGDIRNFTVTKSKDDSDDLKKFFELVVVNLGKDSGGYELTSCAVRQIGAQQKKDKKSAQKVQELVETRIIALEVFNELINEKGKLGIGDAPDHARVLDRASFISSVRDKFLKKVSNPGSTATKAVNSLIKKGLIGGNEEAVWELITVVQNVF